jgi:hypothetical protein
MPRGTGPAIIWSHGRQQYGDRSLWGSHLGEENDTTGHNDMILRQRRITAQVNDRGRKFVICAADNMTIVARPQREGQASRGFET